MGAEGRSYAKHNKKSHHAAHNIAHAVPKIVATVVLGAADLRCNPDATIRVLDQFVQHGTAQSNEKAGEILVP